MYVAIDIGATKTEVAGFNSKNPASQQSSQVFPTSPSFDKEVALLIKAIANASEKITSIQVSIPGLVDKNNTILQVSNLRDYEDKPLARLLKERFDTKVQITQDSICSGLAEYHFGDYSEYTKIVSIIMGSGIGGTFIKKTEKSVAFSPIELCGMVVDKTDARRHESVNTQGILEAYVGGKNIEKHYQLSLADVDPKDMIWREIIDYLTIGINNVTCILQPEIVVIGGGFATKRKQELQEVQKLIKSYDEFVTPPKVVFSNLKGNTSLLGAFARNFVDNVII